MDRLHVSARECWPAWGRWRCRKRWCWRWARKARIGRKGRKHFGAVARTGALRCLSPRSARKSRLARVRHFGFTLCIKSTVKKHFDVKFLDRKASRVRLETPGKAVRTETRAWVDHPVRTVTPDQMVTVQEIISRIGCPWGLLIYSQTEPSVKR